NGNGRAPLSDARPFHRSDDQCESSISERTYTYRPLYPNGDEPGYTNVPLFVFASMVCLSGNVLKTLFAPNDSAMRSNRYPSSRSNSVLAWNVSRPSRLPSTKLP